MKKLLLIIFLFLFIQEVYAIGIGPPRITIDFQPNLEQDISYIVINNLDIAVNVQLYVKGDLNYSVILDQTSFELKPNELKEFTVHLKLPPSIDTPGTHEIRIGALETPATMAEGTVGAKAGVESQLRIIVPYEGKYITADIEATDAGIGETVYFTVSISNIGKEDINNIQAVIDIYEQDNKIAAVKTDSTSIKAGESAELKAEWIAQAEAGLYKTVANIDYDGNEKTVETEFKIGELLIEILSIKTNKFKKGDIAKFTIEVQSKWNKEIKDVYGEIIIDDSITIESKPVTIAPMSKSELELFWDTKDISKTSYQAKAIVYYENKTTERAFEITVQKSTNYFWIIILLIIAAAVYSWYKWKKRKK